MVGATEGLKREPFGQRNRRTMKKPALAKPRKHNRPTAPQIDAKLSLYLAGGILFLVLTGYALAA